MLTCFSLAEKAHANKKNNTGMTTSGRNVPITLKPTWKSPIPNDRNTFPIILSADRTESRIPTAVPADATTKKRNENDRRSLPVDNPILL